MLTKGRSRDLPFFLVVREAMVETPLGQRTRSRSSNQIQTGKDVLILASVNHPQMSLGTTLADVPVMHMPCVIEMAAMDACAKETGIL